MGLPTLRPIWPAVFFAGRKYTIQYSLQIKISENLEGL